jgi:hypothetical protein
MSLNNLPVPLPCLRAAINIEGPGRFKYSGDYKVCPASREDLNNITMLRTL